MIKSCTVLLNSGITSSLLSSHSVRGFGQHSCQRDCFCNRHSVSAYPQAWTCLIRPRFRKATYVARVIPQIYRLRKRTVATYTKGGIPLTRVCEQLWSPGLGKEQADGGPKARPTHPSPEQDCFATCPECCSPPETRRWDHPFEVTIAQLSPCPHLQLLEDIIVQERLLTFLHYVPDLLRCRLADLPSSYHSAIRGNRHQNPPLIIPPTLSASIQTKSRLAQLGRSQVGSKEHRNLLTSHSYHLQGRSQKNHSTKSDNKRLTFTSTCSPKII